MIKFFRKIRYELVEKNKTGKYLKYAIGEIILVMIGILLALQVNNWNENRKLDSKINSVFKIIKSDLVSDIETIDKVLNIASDQNSIAKKLLNKNITYDDYLNCKKCYSYLFGFPDITLNNRGIKLLEENSTNFNSLPDDLSISIIKFYNYFNIEIDVATQEITKDFDNNYYFFKNQKTWFEDYVHGVKNDDFIKYALTATDFRNRVVSFKILYLEIYLGHLKKYKQDALVLIKNINTEVK